MQRFGWRAVLLAGAALVTCPTNAVAQDVSPSESGARTLENTNEIIVSARRRDETLQDVPQTVNVVPADTIQKLRINNASDIAQVVSGLSIEGASSGASGAFGSSTGLRGVPTFLNSNASPIVQFYLNDATTGNGPEVTQSLFDIGQVEVLKGPQGTLRGRSAPGGAITITTRRPDLDQVSGTAILSGTHRGNINLQGAVGVPLIPGVLALRIAGLVDHNDGNGVTSVNAPRDPYVRSEAVRGTLLFEPTPDFSASVMYQRLWRDSSSYRQVAGPGNGLTGPGRNGPPIEARDRLGITDGANESKNRFDFLVGQINWSFAGQRLSYDGSYRRGRGSGRSTQDVANALPGIEYYQTTNTPTEAHSHELRLSSEQRIAGIFDYTIGAFFLKEIAQPTVSGVAQFLTGAFGRPGAPVVQQPLDRYTLRTAITIDPRSVEKSAFANVTAHLGENTEISAGGRFIEFKRRDRYTLGLVGAFNALNNPTGGLLPCSALGALSPQLAGAVASPVYTSAPSVCDLPIASQELQSADRSRTFRPFVYNFSALHRFSPDFTVYGNVGSAFRSAGPAIGITSLTTCCEQVGGPALGSIDDLIFPEPEKSTSYEIGFKASFLNNRGRLNVAAFQQNFRNFFFLTQSTQYLSVPGSLAQASVSSFEFTATAPARVRGIDVEAGFLITPRWNLDLSFTYSHARLRNALIPCNDGNFDGTVDNIVPTVQSFVDAGVLLARCRSNESIARTPDWNLTAQSEYSTPISTGMDGFVRGNFQYFPSNPNSSQGRVIDNYSLLNLFVGLREPGYNWEVSLFANNVLNTQQILFVDPVAPLSSGNPGQVFGRPPSGYQPVGFTPRREFGLLVRYTFGGG
jgi:iron complex outermembrane recepter protein